MRISCKYFVLGEMIGIILLLMLFGFLSSSMVQKSFPEMSGFWSMVTAISTTGAFLAASVAACYGYQAWKLEKLPVVHAIGAFIISKKPEANQIRDRAIFKTDSVHTLQLVNVGRGPAKKVIPSVKKDVIGRFLEDVNPHSFSLPANRGTKEFGEKLLVHGQRFISGDEYELDFEDDRKTASFYIYFEDYTNDPNVTKVKIRKVENADGEAEQLIKTAGLEIWKVIDNTTEKISVAEGNHSI